MIRTGILKALDRFEQLRREQAQSQSDTDPFLPPQGTTNKAVAPLQTSAIDGLRKGCSCTSICSECVEYQMTLNQAH